MKPSHALILGIMMAGAMAMAGLFLSGSSQVAPQHNDPLLSELGFTPSGWMGDWQDITFDDRYVDPDPNRGTSIRIDYTPRGERGWAGIYWLYPSANWGDQPGKDLRNSGYSRVTFYARGERGGEKAEFIVGGVDEGRNNRDSIRPARTTGLKQLESVWRNYSINLTGADMRHVIGGFCWIADTRQGANASTIYLDDISIE